MLKLLGCALCSAIVTGFVIGSEISPVTSAPQPKPTETPLPELQFTPKARVQLKGDRATITLINKTNAAIAYQAVGDTQPRILPGRQTISLRGLRVPVTLTFDRQDAGLLLVSPQQSATSPNTLEVTLDTTTSLSIDGTTMRVENNGSVFLY
jgi:hypothetical protein